MAYTAVFTVLIVRIIGKKLKKVLYCRNLIIVFIAWTGWYPIDRVEEKKEIYSVKKTQRSGACWKNNGFEQANLNQ